MPTQDPRTYFVFECEGEAPSEMSESEVRETLNDALPEWAEGWFNRFDGPSEDEERLFENHQIEMAFIKDRTTHRVVDEDDGSVDTQCGLTLRKHGGDTKTAPPRTVSDRRKCGNCFRGVGE